MWGQAGKQAPLDIQAENRCGCEGGAGAWWGDPRASLVKQVKQVKAWWGGRTPRRVAAAMVKPSVKLVKVKMIKAGRRRPGAAS